MLFKKIFIALVLFIVVFSQSASAWETYDYAPVRVGKGAAFLVTDSDKPADQRAREISSKITQVLKNPDLNPDDIKAGQDESGAYSVRLGEETLAVVTDADVKVFGTPAKRLANRWAKAVKSKAVRIEPIYRNTKKAEVKMLDEHQVLLLLIQIAVLLLVAFICGEIVSSLGQPAVIGQMLAGILLGQSVFGSIFPDLAKILFPVSTSQANLLEVVSWIGVIFLLMLTGLETDVDLIKKQGRSAVGASILGIIIPFSTGFGFAYLIPDELLLNPNHRTIVALFIGTVFSVSSVPVIAKILMDMNLLRRNVAQIILATALVHDTIGCIILALVAALASAHSSLGPELLKAPVGCLVFVAVTLLGRKYIFNVFRWINDHIKSDEALVTAVTVLLLLCAAFTQYVGVHVVLGAFMVGFLLSQTPIVRSRVLHSFEVITMGIFAPIFFAGAGLHVNLKLLADPRLLILTIAMSLIACGSKVGANFIGGKWGGLSKWESLCLGFGANAPGAMGLIVGILGYSMGIINVELLSVIIVMSLVTTAITPPLMKWALKNVEVSTDEQERLAKEETKSQTHIGDIKRLLIPTGGGKYGELSGHVVEAIGAHHKIEATAFTVTSDNHEAKTSDVFERVSKGIKDKNITLISRTSQSENYVESIVEESKLGYDLILIGAAVGSEAPETIFGESVDQLIINSSCPLLVINWKGDDLSSSLKNILIPSSGADTSIKSLEMGMVIAKGTGAKVTCLNVMESSRIDEEDVDSANHAKDITDSASELAGAFEVEMETVIKEGETASDEILAAAKEMNIDLIIIGGIKRPTGKLFLGQIVQKVVHEADCAVAVYII